VECHDLPVEPGALLVGVSVPSVERLGVYCKFLSTCLPWLHSLTAVGQTIQTACCEAATNGTLVPQLRGCLGRRASCVDQKTSRFPPCVIHRIPGGSLAGVEALGIGLSAEASSELTGRPYPSRCLRSVPNANVFANIHVINHLFAMSEDDGQ
jgi:hypothetical protein